MLKNRLTYGITLLSLIFLVFIYEHSLTYIAIYATLILPIFSLAITLSTRKSFTITESLSKQNVIKGEIVTYFFSVKNNNFLPYVNVKVLFCNDNHAIETDFNYAVFSIMPHKTHELSFKVLAKYRGNYDIGIQSITLYDFLGLFSFTKLHKNRVSFSIIPNVIDIVSLPLNNINDFNDENNSFTQEEDYNIISDIRKYQPNDGYKKIHWKISARKNELMSKNYQLSKKNSVKILLDNSTIDTSLEEKIILEDSIIEACVSVLNYAKLRMFSLYLNFMGSDIQTHEGEFNYLYSVVSQISFNSNESFDNYYYNYSKTQAEIENLVIFTQQITDTVFLTSQNLALFGNNVTILYFKDEDMKKVSILNETNRLNCFSYNDIV